MGTLFRELCKNGLADRDIVSVVDSGKRKEACIRWGAQWRNLANTTEWYMCSHLQANSKHKIS